MILANCLPEPARNMVSESVQASCLKNDEAENSSPEQKDQKDLQHEDMTLHNMYYHELYDEDNDSDWDPLQEPPAALKWFCVNCTMPNSDDVVHCGVCPSIICSIHYTVDCNCLVVLHGLHTCILK